MGQKIFSEKQVDVSAFLGGPIPPGILIFKNYMRLGNERAAYKSLAVTLIFTVAFFYAILQIPDAILDKIPDIAFSGFYGLLVFLFFRYYMATDVKAAFESGMEKASNWNVAGLTILGLVLNLSIVFMLSYNQPFYEGQKITFDGNELYYNENTSKEKADMLIDKFVEIDFFGPDYGNIGRLETVNGKYFITMIVDEQYWSDDEIMLALTTMKWSLEAELDQSIELKLEHVYLTGKSKYKTL
jgi:hypothetical protein